MTFLQYNYYMLNIYSENNQAPEVPKSTPVPKVNFRRYEDPTGEFTGGRLGFSLWWAKNTVLFYRLALIALIAVGAAFWLFSIVNWTIYGLDLLNQSNQEKAGAGGINYSVINQNLNAAALQIVSTDLFPEGADKVEAVSVVVNPNEHFVATFDYYFTVNGTTTPPTKATILANSKTLVVAFGLTDTGGMSGATLQIKNLAWRRISNHDVPDPKSYQDGRLNFTIASSTFESSGSAAGLSTNRLAFILKNESAYGYKQPQFYVGLYNQDVMVGVMPLQTDDFHSAEAKDIELRNFTPNLQVQNIEIFPLIDVYDSEVYLPPER